MDFTILAVVLLLCGGIPLRNKIYKERKLFIGTGTLMV